MRRRSLLKVLLLAATARQACAQEQTKTYRIAIVHPSAPIADMSETGDNPYYRALFSELRRLGYVAGRNLVVARYSGEGQEERFIELAREVVDTKPDLVVAAASRLVLSFKAVTKTVPIVASMADPVSFGVVANLARPGGNITGVSVEVGPEIWGKRLEILLEAVPTASRVGFLGSRQIWDLPQVAALREETRQSGISLLGPPIEAPIQEGEYRRVIGAMTEAHVDGLIVSDQLENVTYRRLIVELTNSARLPAVSPYREHFEVGGLMAYGPSLADLYRRLGGYVDRILRGAHPGQLPIYLASKFDLLINLRAARALGLGLAPSLLARADEVIE